jgi:two-component system response regulator RegX3
VTATPPAFDQHEPTGRLVLVEDDALQAEALAFFLRQEGYAVELATTGAQALAAVRTHPTPDAVVLDVTLPDLNGIEVARRLRAGSSVPIIMLTARRQESDKIIGLDAGADDYVTKPFSHGELLARIRAQLRRRLRPEATEREPSAVFTVGNLELDAGRRRLTRAGSVVELSAREFDIVQLLAEAAGHVVGRRQLIRNIWGPDFVGDERALDVYVHKIRIKVEPEPSEPRYLHTVRGVGYRLADEHTDG